MSQINLEFMQRYIQRYIQISLKLNESLAVDIFAFCMSLFFFKIILKGEYEDYTCGYGKKPLDYPLL